MRQHIEGAYKCRTCGVGFNTTRESIDHRMTVHDDIHDTKFKLFKKTDTRDGDVGAYYDY